MDIRKFERKAFYVEAVQVTEANMEDVAKWCGGPIKTQTSEKHGVEQFIEVNVQRPLNKKQKQAMLTDWVIKSSTGWKVYTDRAFQNSFDVADEVKDEGGRNVFERNQTDEPVELRTINEPAEPITDADEFLKELSEVEPAVQDARDRKKI